MPIKATIWDIGGVIVRTEDKSPRDALAAELGVTRDDLNVLFFSGPEGTRTQKGDLSVAELMTGIRAALDLAPEAHPDLLERFFAGDRVDYELVDFIRSLKPRYKTGIISNAWPGLGELLDQWEITNAFDFVIGSGDVGIMKPDPKIYRLALDGLGVRPEEAVFVDDFIENVRGARKTGMKAIHFQSPKQALGELQQFLDG